MLFTELGIVTDCNDEQSLNVALSIIMTEDGIAMEFSLKQPEKALSPMLVTELGMVIIYGRIHLALNNHCGTKSRY